MSPETIKADKEVRIYHHLTEGSVLNLSCGSYVPTIGGGSVKRFDNHTFYEGVIPHDGRDALFFLQKLINDERSNAQLGMVIIDIALANINHSMSQIEGTVEHEKYDRYQEASHFFAKQWNSRKIVEQTRFSSFTGLM